MTLICWTDAVAETQQVLLSAGATGQRGGHRKKTALHFIKVGRVITRVENKNLGYLLSGSHEIAAMFALFIFSNNIY